MTSRPRNVVALDGGMPPAAQAAATAAAAAARAAALAAAASAAAPPPPPPISPTRSRQGSRSPSPTAVKQPELVRPSSAASKGLKLEAGAQTEFPSRKAPRSPCTPKVTSSCQTDPYEYWEDYDGGEFQEVDESNPVMEEIWDPGVQAAAPLLDDHNGYDHLRGHGYAAVNNHYDRSNKYDGEYNHDNNNELSRRRGAGERTREMARASVQALQGRWCSDVQELAQRLESSLELHIAELQEEVQQENKELRNQLRHAAVKGLMDGYPLDERTRNMLRVITSPTSKSTTPRSLDMLKPAPLVPAQMDGGAYCMDAAPLAVAVECVTTEHQVHEQFADVEKARAATEDLHHLSSTSRNTPPRQVSTESPTRGSASKLSFDDQQHQSDITKHTSGSCSDDRRVNNDDDDDGDAAEDGKDGRRSSYMQSIRSSWMSYKSTGTTTPSKRSCMESFVNSWKFDSIFACFILLNCATMGLQAHIEVNIAAFGKAPFPETIVNVINMSEHVFTAAFSIECLMRMKVFGWRGFWPTDSSSRANCVDLMLVLLTGVLLTWIIPFLTYLTGDAQSEGSYNMLTVLRAVRVARLARVFHRVPLFREAWMLIRGLSDSARTLFWTCVVIFFVTYIFAILGLVMVVNPLLHIGNTTPDEELRQKIDDLMVILGGIDKLMYTLIQVLTMDSFHSFMRDIMMFVQWSWLYFYAYIALACIVLMNLVTAVIVEHAMSASQSDGQHLMMEKEMRMKRDLRELKHLFRLMDADGSGTLCWDEFKDSFLDPEMAKKWLMLDFAPEECKELFQLLDDGDGEIETNEFFEGLGRMKGSAQSKDVFRLQKSLNKISVHLEELLDLEGSQKKSPSASKGPSEVGSPRRGSVGSSEVCADMLASQGSDGDFHKPGVQFRRGSGDRGEI